MISIQSISKSFAQITVLSQLSFSVEPHTFLGIIGPSGCGKTTLLNLIAHLDEPDIGSIGIPHGNTIGYMMQEAPLLPWRTLAENAVLGKEIINGKNAQTATSVEPYFKDFDLIGYEKSYPGAASGGMRQRVALIRTLLLRASVLLLDEPFSNLDFDIKLKVQRHVMSHHLQNHTTSVLVTHDIEDAIALSDRVIVLSDKPTAVKADIPIDLEIMKRDPVEARKAPRFREYFVRLWDELKYLDNNH